MNEIKPVEIDKYEFEYRPLSIILTFWDFFGVSRFRKKQRD